MDPVTFAALLLAGFAYAQALQHPGARRPPVGTGAVAAFYTGLGLAAAALGPPIHGLSEASFAWHMVQHLLLVLVVPPLLALGAPVTLALRTLAPDTRNRVLMPLLRSRAARLAANPVVGWIAFVVVSFGVHLTGVFDAALTDPWVHGLEHAVWIGVALLYWWPIVGRDPSPSRIPYPTRLLSLLLLMPVMSFLALALHAAPRVLYPAYARSLGAAEALADQRVAAVVMWLAGDVAVVVAMLCVAVAWKHHEERLPSARSGSPAP